MSQITTTFKETDSFSETLSKLKRKTYDEVNFKNPVLKKKFLAVKQALLNNKDKFVQTLTSTEDIWQGISGNCLVVISRSLTQPRGYLTAKNITSGEVYYYEGYYPAYLILSFWYKSKSNKNPLGYNYVPERQPHKILELPENVLSWFNTEMICKVCGENLNKSMTKTRIRIKD